MKEVTEWLVLRSHLCTILILVVWLIAQTITKKASEVNVRAHGRYLLACYDPPNILALQARTFVH